MSYDVFYNRVRGYSHIKKDIPCEDYGMKRDLGTAKIFAVADGHGDSNCIRSSLGSQYICEVVCDELETFSKEIQQQNWDDLLLNDKHESNKIIAHLINSIVSKWTEKVYQDFENNPFSAEELSNAPLYSPNFIKGKMIEKAYGTTLISALLTERYLLLLQQGDGRCDVFDCKGNVSQPIPWDDRCLANATTSLCDPDAAQSCRYYIIDLDENPVIACVAGSDGVEDSFPMSMEKMHAYYRELLKYACENGIEELENYLSTELSRLSENGSADDVTVCGIVDIERTKCFLDDFSELNKLVDIEDEIAIYTDRINSIENGGKFEYLKNKYTKICSEYEKAKSKVELLKKQCNDIANEIQVQQKKMDEHADQFNGLPSMAVDLIKLLSGSADNLSQLKDKLAQLHLELADAENELVIVEESKEKIESQYFPYIDKYEDYKRKRQETVEKLNALKSATD
ncbi:protein phosphatase 2C domain-containing protein [Ruminococcus sp. zg-924]|uniref:protein phosphatase 2C domain-containing protein n=1 Tax=Ruminococcus sp. zg-924 TaxID=2678505 RepID=UPI00210AFA86|nr:protein phosphatase 2C domain-containing protein [Ruminococcus sp. zg-924]